MPADPLTILRSTRATEKLKLQEMLDNSRRSGVDLSDAEAREFDQLAASIKATDSRIEDLEYQEIRSGRHHRAQERSGSPAYITREASTYSPQAAREGVSMVVDLYRSQYSGDFAASDRLARHRREVDVEQRDIGTPGLGGLVPPQYMIDAFAPIARAGRPTANALRQAQIPGSGMSLVIPRGTTGALTAVQTPQNTPVALIDYVETDLTVPVITVAGQANLSRQALERGIGVDQIILADLAADYAVRLDQQVLSGTGAGGQALGLLATPGVNVVTFTQAAPTVALLWPKLADAVQRVNTLRFMPPTFIAMHPRRWAWITAAVDSTGRPLFNFSNMPNASALSPMAVGAAAEYGQVVGMAMGLPVVTDASIPTTYLAGVPGAGTEDVILVLRGGLSGDLILWEDGDGTPKQLKFEETIAGSLTIKLVCYGFSAFTAGRYPAGVSIISGSGCAAPTF